MSKVKKQEINWLTPKAKDHLKKIAKINDYGIEGKQDKLFPMRSKNKTPMSYGL